MESGTLLIRRVKEDDFNAILTIAKKVGGGFTSLPNDPSLIREKIKTAELSFNQKLKKQQCFYFFVLEDTRTKTIVGSSALQGYRGFPSVFYVYGMQSLDPTNTILTLEIKYNDTSVFSTLFAEKDQSKTQTGRGKFASRARCLFIAEFPEQFYENFIAEMRGVLNTQGESPFWDAVGKPIMHISFNEANDIVSRKGTAALAERIPKTVSLATIPEQAREVIGKVHKDTEAALHILKQEGFVFQYDLDIIDSGPIMRAEKNLLRSVKESRKLQVIRCVETINSQEQLYMISNTVMENFKATIGFVQMDGDKVTIENKIAKLLDVQVMDYIRCSTFY